MAISLARSIAEEGLVGMELNMELINKFSSSMRAGGPSVGFSIRGMVQEMRKRDIRKTWPFSSVLLDQYLGQGSRSSLQVGSAAQGSPGSRNDTDATKRDLQGAKNGEESGKEDQIELQLEFEELRVDESEKWDRQTEMIERSIGQLGLAESEKSEEKKRILYCDARIEAETLQRGRDESDSDKGDHEEEENDEGKFEQGLTGSGSCSGFGLGLELSEQINGISGALCCPVCHGTWHSLSALNAHLDRCLSPKKIKGKGQKTRSITDIIATQKFALQQQKDKRSRAAAAARFKRCSKSKKSGGIKRKQKSCSGNLNDKGEDEDDEDESAGPDKTSETSKQIDDASHSPSKGGTGASDPSADSQDEREAVHQPCTLNAQDIDVRCEENFASGVQNGGIRRDSDDTTLRIGLLLANSSEPVDAELPVQAPDFLAEASEPSNPSAEAVDLSVNPVQTERSAIAAPSSSPADPNKSVQQPRPTIPVYESVISSLRSSTAISIGSRQFVPTWKAAVVMATLGAPMLRQGPSAPSSCATAANSFVERRTPIPEPLPNSRVDLNVELQQRPHASTMAPVSHSNQAGQPNITHVLVINSIVPPAQINPEQFAPPQPADHCHLQTQWQSQPVGLRSSFGAPARPGLFDRSNPHPHPHLLGSHNVPAWLQPINSEPESPLHPTTCLVSGSAEKPVFRLLGQTVSLPGSSEPDAPHTADLEKGLHFQTPDHGHDVNAGLLRISQENLSNRGRISDSGSIRLISRQEFDQTFPAFYYQNRNGGSYQVHNSNASYVGNSTNLLNLQQYGNSPRNVQRDTSGLPPWLAAAKKQQKDAEMEANVIVIDDDEPDDVSQSCASEVTRQIDARFNSENFRSQNMQGLMSGSKRHAESVISVNNLEPAQKQARFNQLESSFGPLPRQASNLGAANALAAKRGAAAQEYKARIAMMKADGLELLYEGHPSFPGTGVHGSTRQWGSQLIDDTSNPRLFVSPLQSGLREGLASGSYPPNFGIHSVGNSCVGGTDPFRGGAQNPHWTITSDQNQFMRESHSSSLKKVKQPNRQLPPVFGWVPQPQVISRAVNGYNTGGGLISTANGHYVVMSGTIDSSSSSVFPGQQNSRIYPAHFSTQGMGSAGWSMSANVPITSYGKRAPWTAAPQE